ncbi:PTS sugar transporter subunit IIB [Clostridium sp. Cult3]|uniref:PTS sugar transporter subunit IIB n=1 Tax=Clostridium sp. Cult3 TaxID=2079004 RepID=UPI001F2EAF82|nr:PTS sugar transporter subunit IIB [Clostridium sp. Cult3]MCF6461375.1 PTS galactitol transporter subunit IIB [Clostridium sp. Cult3]
MKKVIVACGAGLATSTMIREKIETLLEENNIQCEIVQSTLNGIPSVLDNANLIITTMNVDEDYGVPLIQGSAFLTGINEDVVSDKVISILKEGDA